MVTSLVRSPHHYGHPFSVPNCIPQCNLAPFNTVTSPLRSLLPSPAGDRIREVPLNLAIDSGGHASDLIVARNCCMARMLPEEAELVSEWTGLPGGGGAKTLNHHMNTPADSSSSLQKGRESFSSKSISSSGSRWPDVSAKLMPVLCHSACCCHRTKRICDVFLPSLSWLSSASDSERC